MIGSINAFRRRHSRWLSIEEDHRRDNDNDDYSDLMRSSLSPLVAYAVIGMLLVSFFYSDVLLMSRFDVVNILA